jgi:hypothetical protein
MFTFSPLRRAGTALAASALALALAASVVVGGTTTANAVSSSSPAGHGATWLSHQLNRHGLIHNGAFDYDDYGLTIDTTFALKAIGGHPRKVRRARHALSRHVDNYTTGVDFGSTAEFAGADAKLLVLAQRTGGKPRHFGGTNLVRRLNRRVIDAGPSAGRIQDVVDVPNHVRDSANVIGQIYAARGLLKSHSAHAPAVLRFLLAQQCRSGFFRLDFNPHQRAPRQGCSKGDPADTDVTSLAVVELASVSKGHPALKRALAGAVRWLKRHQGKNGAFGGAGPTSAANANSTGLAGWALLSAGACHRAVFAAEWLSRLQVGGHLAGTPLVGERGAIAYDRATLKTAKHDGIDKTTRDRWRRATAQAAPALLALSHCGT